MTHPSAGVHHHLPAPRADTTILTHPATGPPPPVDRPGPWDQALHRQAATTRPRTTHRATLPGPTTRRARAAGRVGQVAAGPSGTGGLGPLGDLVGNVPVAGQEQTCGVGALQELNDLLDGGVPRGVEQADGVVGVALAAS